MWPGQRLPTSHRSFRGRRPVKNPHADPGVQHTHATRVWTPGLLESGFPPGARASLAIREMVDLERSRVSRQRLQRAAARSVLSLLPWESDDPPICGSRGAASCRCAVGARPWLRSRRNHVRAGTPPSERCFHRIRPQPRGDRARTGARAQAGPRECRIRCRQPGGLHASGACRSHRDVRRVPPRTRPGRVRRAPPALHVAVLSDRTGRLVDRPMGSAARSRLAASDGHADCGTSRIRAGHRSGLIAFRPGGRSAFRRPHRTSLHDDRLRAVLRWVSLDVRGTIAGLEQYGARPLERSSLRDRLGAITYDMVVRIEDALVEEGLDLNAKHWAIFATSLRGASTSRPSNCPAPAAHRRRPPAGCCRRTRPPTTRTRAPRSRDRAKSSRSHFHVRNLGWRNWSSTEAQPVLASYHWQDGDGRTLVLDGARTPLASDIAPGSGRESSLCVSRRHQPLDSAYLQSISCMKA